MRTRPWVSKGPDATQARARRGDRVGIGLALNPGAQPALQAETPPPKTTEVMKLRTRGAAQEPKKDQGGQTARKDHEESLGRDIHPEMQHMLGTLHAKAIVADSSAATPAKQLPERWKG